MDNNAIFNEVYEQITLPARQFKEILASRIIDSSSFELFVRLQIDNDVV